MEHVRVLSWVPQWPGDDVPIWINVSALDAAWQRDKGFHIGLQANGSQSPGKYDRFGRWLATHDLAVWMPHVSMWRSRISFTDGRHRFAWLRDQGLEALPVTTEPRQSPKLAERFGSPLRVSRLTIPGPHPRPPWAQDWS